MLFWNDYRNSIYNNINFRKKSKKDYCIYFDSTETTSYIS